jgi:tight adherence protein C
VTLWLALCAAAAAVGVVLVASGAVDRRRTLWRQVAPYVGTILPESSVKVGVDRLLASTVTRRIGWAWGTDRQLARLCRATGEERNVVQVRTSQVAHSAIAVAAVAGWSLLRHFTHPGSPAAPSVVLIAAAPLAAGWWTRARLEGEVSRRAREMDMQLPTVLELLAFAIAAGESMYAALDRVTRTLNGVLASQLRVAVRDIATGQSVSAALHDVAQSTTSPAVARAAHAIDVALERGTPLAEVLRSQAADARGHTMRQMLVLAGKKETAMMIPVVFLVLPTIVAVAIYPGIVQLHMW